MYVSSGTGRGLDGPYLISSVPETAKYTLSFEDGSKVENGKVFDEKRLEFAS